MTTPLGNGEGKGSVPTVEKMRAWDSLPPRVREQLMTAPYPYNPAQVASVCREHGEAKAVKAMDRVFQRDVSNGYSERGLPYLEWTPK